MRTPTSLIAALSLVTALGSPSLLAAVPDRITASIDNTRYVAVDSPAHPLARPESDRGTVDAGQRIAGISLDLRLSPAQQADLDSFLEDQRNPGSPDFHRWLTPAQFADRFGASQNDVAKIVSWLQSEGFTIQHIGAGRTWILFAGTAAQVEQSFHTSIHHYEVNGAMHYANSTAPSIPEAFSAIVASIRGLDDFHPRPATNPAKAKKIAPQLDRGGYQFVGPADLATIYDINPLYQAGADGTGQTLAIAGQTDISLLDIAEFRSLFNLPANVPQVVLVGDDPGTSEADLPEADIDIEWSGSSAVNATIIYVNSLDVLTSLQYAIDEALAPVVSMSYGSCEADNPNSTFRTLAQQANAEGITWLNAAGDQGAAGCDYGALIAVNGPSVIFPANIPEVVAVGGTEFDEGSGTYWSTTNGNGSLTALGYIPEMVWNDTSPGNPIEAGGGGVSAVFSKPWWQAGPGVPADGARDVPDVSLDASADHDGYIIVSSDIMMSIGGTSVASPAFAGMLLVVNQYLMNQGVVSQMGLGNVNPTFYALAQNPNNIFHDITVGNNIVPCEVDSTGCTTGSFGYNAGPGYDLASGLGTIDAWNLATGWNGAQTGVGVTTSLRAAPATLSTTGSTLLTATVTALSGGNPPSGTVNFTENGATLGSAALKLGSGTSSTATLTLTGSVLGAGTDTVSADYLPTGGFLASSGSTSVTVTGTATTITATASPATIAASSTTVLKATVHAASGSATPTGSVTFTDGSTTLGSAAVSSGTASITVSGLKMGVGINTITASFSGTAAFSNSSAQVYVTVNPVATTTTVSANPATVPSSSSTIVTATIAPATGSAAPTGDVIFMAGATNLGTVPVASSSSSASILLQGSSLPLGANTITASYYPTGDFTSSSGTGTVTVIAGTTTSVSPSAGTFAASASTVVTATITPTGGAAVPAGTVTFSVGGNTLGSATIAGGSASLTVTGMSLSIGSNTITASYPGQSNLGASTGTATVTVTPITTTTNVSVSNPTITTSGTTVLTATVVPSGGTVTPMGTVAFMLGATKLGSASYSGSGVSITVKASALAVGNNTIAANFTAIGSFASSTNNANVTVTPPPVATTLTLSAAPSSITTAGNTVLTASIWSSSGTPAGNVTFYFGSTVLGSAVVAGGTASITASGSSFGYGDNTVTATFTPTNNFLSSSGEADLVVSAPPIATSISIGATATTFPAANSTTLTATVSPTSGTAVPTGSVTFSMGATTLGTVALVGGSASASASLTVQGTTLGVGSDTVTVTYAGNSTYSGSSNTIVLTVQ